MIRLNAEPSSLRGASMLERRDLLMQCELFKADARWMLEQIGVGRNWWTIDIGCGPLGILDLLAESTGPGTHVIGLERDPNMLEFGRELITERGLDAVRLIQGDAHETGLPTSSFDFTHSRLLLADVPNPMSVVSEMARITRPGGWVALEELDWGTDAESRLTRLLMQAGLTHVHCKIHTSLYQAWGCKTV